jgi:hypothetical protein
MTAVIPIHQQIGKIWPQSAAIKIEIAEAAILLESIC